MMKREGLEGLINNIYYQKQIMTNAISSKHKPGFNKTIYKNVQKMMTTQYINKAFDQIDAKIKDINQAFDQKQNKNECFDQLNRILYGKSSLKSQRTDQISLIQTKDGFEEMQPLSSSGRITFTKASRITIQSCCQIENKMKNRQVKGILSQSLDLSQPNETSIFSSCRNLKSFRHSNDSATQEIILLPKIFRKKQNKLKLSFDKLEQNAIGLRTNDQSIQRDAVTSGRNELKRLLSNLNHQIQIDGHFLKTKEWFNGYQSKTKWLQLSQQLNKFGLQFGEIAIKSIFSINSEYECSFPLKTQTFSIGELVSAYSSTQNYWRKYISNKYDVGLLQLHNFKEQQIDVRNKGYISIEDLVYFINYNLQTQYCNRDLALIFKRLKKFKFLYFVDLLESLTIQKIK